MNALAACWQLFHLTHEGAGVTRASPRPVAGAATVVLAHRAACGAARSRLPSGQARLAACADCEQYLGRPVDGNLLQCLSPLGWEHINLTGDYA